VLDPELLRELCLQLLAAGLGLVQGQLAPQHDVRGQRRRLRPDRPDVEVVHRVDAVGSDERVLHRVDVQPLRDRLEQHAGGVAEELPGRDEHEDRDEDRHHRVDPLGAGRQHDRTGDHDADRAGRVRREVDERAAQVQVLARGPGDHPGAARVDDQTEEPDHEDAETVDRLGMREALDRLVDHPARHEHEHDGVRLRREHFGPQHPVGVAGRRGPGDECLGEDRDRQRDDVRRHVRRVRDQGQ
jgi:hypothetical protein